LLGTKLRALYQRKQARDLFDLEIALTRLPVEPQRIVAAFLEYMVRDGHAITRAQVEQNFALKMRDGAFAGRPQPTSRDWRSVGSHRRRGSHFRAPGHPSPGDPWKGEDH
jgi:hypothetical protein